jgi:mRNA interferase MazF
MIQIAFQWYIFQAELDPTRGSEQRGKRPVLVVSHETINTALPIVTVLPLTSYREGRRVYSTEVLIPASEAGLPQDSIVMAHQIRTLAKERLGRCYGELKDEDLREQVRQAMRIYLDLE